MDQNPQMQFEKEQGDTLPAVAQLSGKWQTE